MHFMHVCMYVWMDACMPRQLDSLADVASLVTTGAAICLIGDTYLVDKLPA